MSAVRRTPLVAALCLVAALAAPATAAKPGCPMLTDEAGDAKNISKPIADDPALDFISGDIVSDRSRLTVVMRLVGLTRPSPGTAGGATYDYGFAIAGKSYVLRAMYRAVDGDEFELLTEGTIEVVVTTVYEWTPTPAHVDGVFDEDLAEIRMSVPLADFPEATKPGQTVGNLHVRSYLSADDVFGAGADAMYDLKKTYQLGSKGCIPVKI